jgi:gamma-F420-2:alpha-L-glutamate ligase
MSTQCSQRLSPIQGLILYTKSKEMLGEEDYSVLRLLEVAESKNIDLKIVRPSEIELIVSRDDKKSILINDKPTQVPDFVISRMGSNTSYYALAVIRHLEHLGVYVCNGARSIEIVKDKLHMHQMLAHSKLPSPKTMLVKFPVELSVISREIGFPLVIKNVTGMQGKGIYLCDSEEKFTDIMELIYANNERSNIIIQELVKSSYGRDLRVFVLGGRVIGCMQRSSKDSFKANFSRGGSVSEFKITPEIEWLATEAARLVNLDIAGIDLLFDESGFKICEANSSPGFKGLEKVYGRKIADEILDYIQLKIGSGYSSSAIPQHPGLFRAGSVAI